MEKQNYFTRALLFSIVMCVFGGTLFGVLYYFGYFWAWLSVIEIVIASAVFFKFINKPNLFHLIFCVIWCTVWAFVFNFLAVFLCEVLAFCLKQQMSFKEAYLTVMDLWKHDVAIKEYFKERIIQIAVLTGYGSAVGLIYGIVMYIAKRKIYKNQTTTQNQNINENKPVVVSAGSDFFGPSQTSQYINVYNRVLKLCKDALVDFYENDDKDLLDRKIERINERIMQEQSPATKQLINTHSKKELNKNPSKIDKKANEIILKITY